MGKLTDII